MFDGCVRSETHLGTSGELPQVLHCAQAGQLSLGSFEGLELLSAQRAKGINSLKCAHTFGLSFSFSFVLSLSLSISLSLYIYTCARTHTYPSLSIYIYIYTCACIGNGMCLLWRPQPVNRFRRRFVSCVRAGRSYVRVRVDIRH